MRLLLLFLLMPATSTEIVVPRACLTKIELTEKAECSGPDLQHMTCRGLLLTKKKGCEYLRIVK